MSAQQLPFKPDTIEQQKQVPLLGGFFSQDIGNTFVELPIEKDFEADSESIENNDADLDNMDKMFGSGGGNANKMPSKKFKEDEDDFFDS